MFVLDERDGRPAGLIPYRAAVVSFLNAYHVSGNLFLTLTKFSGADGEIYDEVRSGVGAQD